MLKHKVIARSEVTTKVVSSAYWVIKGEALRFPWQGETRDGWVGMDITGENFCVQDTQERRKGATLTNTTRQREERRKITITVDSTLNTTIQHINPLNKIRAEAHVTKSATQERPVDPVESLLLVKREDCDRDVRGRGKVDHITEKREFLAYISARDSTALIRRHHGMDDLTQTPRQCPRGDLVMHQSIETPTLWIPGKGGGFDIDPSQKASISLPPEAIV